MNYRQLPTSAVCYAAIHRVSSAVFADKSMVDKLVTNSKVVNIEKRLNSVVVKKTLIDLKERRSKPVQCGRYTTLLG